MFQQFAFSLDPAKIRQWIPLVLVGRDHLDRIAVTCVKSGTDVNFGALRRKIFEYLQINHGVKILLAREVVEAENLTTKESKPMKARFVFIEEGGGTLPFLEKSGIPEGPGYGGFPIIGQWLRCTKKQVIERQQAKAYG
ncbi:malate:quinone oxidoreductase [Flavihumibacter fluvii]|uniref:malate:quinone oxidoreductase n=1 Tax=Flavihumibacter fluvii TaxID=2838157 RepID=UPI001BDDCB68|nr:malate:quinone oxidoreductase [Flavihumibacter fluvii]